MTLVTLGCVENANASYEHSGVSEHPYKTLQPFSKGNKMDIEYFRLLMSEQHLLMMRIVKILEYSNIQDLKTINSFLTENKFVKKEDLKEDERKRFVKDV